jgi:hypothetical protein
MASSSVLEQYRVSDLVEWFARKQLRLNPHFQRRSVWSENARVFLIDTILRRMPMPKIFMRTKVDLTTKQSYREIVDGQQRLRAIVDFANDKMLLSDRAGDLAGLRYSTLPAEFQEAFLSYPIAVDQLINASDTDVLEIFARLNSYTVSLNPPELRHAQFQGNFKWAVHRTSIDWATLWEKFGVVSVKQRLRMQDDSLMAEMFGVILEGVKDGGQNNITKLYKKFDSDFAPRKTVKTVNSVLTEITQKFDDVLVDSAIASAPHFLMLFAAVAHAIHGIPEGDMGGEMPARNPRALSNLAIARENLATLNRVLESVEPVAEMLQFWTASSATTQRIRSRLVRFPMFYRALLPHRL